MKKTIIMALMAAVSVSASAQQKQTIEIPSWLSNVKLSGYGMTQYQYSGQKDAESNSFNIRMARISLEGRIAGDFYWKTQIQFNGNTSTLGSSPRMVDLFAEWQKYEYFKVKIGQFKNPFTFENPMHPIDQGFMGYSQNVSKLAGFSDRAGEHASNGRDIGLQLQGDFLKNANGRNLLHYQIGVFNGQGINRKDVGNQKDVIGGFWVSPIKGMRIGGFGWIGSYNRTGYWSEGMIEQSGSRKVGRYRYALSAEYKDADWQIRSEYIHNTGGAFKATANTTSDLSNCNYNGSLGDRADAVYLACIAPIVRGKLRAKARYDLYRPAGSWATAKTIYKAGFNYLFCKNIEIQTEYSFVNDRSLAKHNYSMADVQFSVRF